MNKIKQHQKFDYWYLLLLTDISKYHWFSTKISVKLHYTLKCFVPSLHEPDWLGISMLLI